MTTEILNMEQLNTVVGGNIGRTAADSKILYEYGLVSDWHSSFTTLVH